MKSSRILRRAVLPAVAAVVLSALTACGGVGASSDDSGPYRILDVGPQTGFSGANGKALDAGLRAAVDDLNRGGGLNGRQVEVVTKDDQTDPTKAVTLLREELSGRDQPDLVVTGVSSNESLAMAPLLTREKIIGMSNISSPKLDDREQFPYFFSTAIQQRDLMAAAARFLGTQGGPKRVALVVQDDALRQAVEPVFTEQMAVAGHTTSVHPFAPDSLDIAPAFEAAKAAGADWIYVDAVGAAVPRVFEGRLKAGAETIPAIGGSGIGTTAFTDNSTPAQRAGFHPALYPLTAYIAPEKRSPELTTLFERVGGNSGPLPMPISIYAYGWDTVRIWAAGVRQAGSADAEAVTKALENLRVSKQEGGWLMWSRLYGPNTHFPQPGPDDVIFKQVTGRQDTMFVTAG